METVPRTSSQLVTQHTKAALDGLGTVLDRLTSRSLPPRDDPASERLVRELGAELNSPKQPSGDVLEQIRRRLVGASRQGALTETNLRDRRYAPWLLWNGKPAAADVPGVLALVLNEARNSRPTLRRLIQAYLRDFNSQAAGIREAAACIRDQLTTPDPRLERWRVAHGEVVIFDPRRGPASLADRLLAEQDPDRVIVRYGLAEPLLTEGGYMRAVEEQVRERIPAFLRDNGTRGLDRISQIIAPIANQLRFPDCRAETARAMLRAWLTGRGEPASAVGEPVLRLVLSWLGDPRLPVHKQRWDEVGKEEAGLVRRWLTRASLDLFFKLIDEHALDSQWRYRHAFWAAYLREGAISDAWLAFGPTSHRFANQVPDLRQAYARLRGGADRKQSALLMKIGPLVLADFSHNGKLRAWPDDWHNSPQLGRSEYERVALAGKCLPFPPNPWNGRGGDANGDGLSHFASDRGHWQGSAAAMIERRTGFRITPQQWRPR